MEHDFRLLFEESPDVLLVLLPDAPRYTMVAATRARLEATMTTREQCIGKGLFELFPDNPADPSATGTSNLRASLERVLATKKPDTMAVQRYDIRAPDGSFTGRYWSPKNVPVLSAEGDVRYIIHKVEDVTDLVKASELSEELRGRASGLEREVLQRSAELSKAVRELRGANAKLGELDAAKNVFFGNVSHELRTPLTLMLGPLEDALADHGLSAPVREHLRRAHDNAERLLRLVNALLDFARLQAGRLHAVFAPIDLSTVTAEIAGMFQSAAARTHLELSIDCPKLVDPVWVDRDLWEKVVSNLVANALKYTHAGEVTVRMREEQARVVLTVADTGIGIAEADLSRIFERFYRVEGAVGRTHEGTGIGLSLVRELVELHGGTVSVTSVLGRGTTFRIEVPKGFGHLPNDLVSQTPAVPGARRDAAAQAAEVRRWTADVVPETVEPHAPAAGQDRAKVLVVDDNADLRVYLCELLSTTYAVSTAADGQLALELAKKAPPDLVVSDVMMPNMDGVALTRALRSDEATAPIPVILLSARVGEEAAVEGLSAGADDYIAKPFTARELLARVRTHVDLATKRRAWVRELTRINHELDAFNASVSHDLRTPAGQVQGFAQLLREDAQSRLSDRAVTYVGYIESAAQRMLELTEHLLRLARLSRQPLERTQVDLSSLADDIVSTQHRSAAGRNIEVRVAPGMHADCDPALMHIVLDNLVGNAFKYTSKKPSARIEIGSEGTAGGAQVFFIRDDGAGFDASRADRLFTPFARMHGMDEFPGIGIGLATVQRIIDRHGGRVWAKSAVGSGATFYFTLGEHSNQG